MSDESNEEWRVIEGSDGFYEVSSAGRVRSWLRHGVGRQRRTEPLTLAQVNNRGYRYVSVFRDGRRSAAKVHHLVLVAFIGPRPPGYEGSHVNGKPWDNRAESLCWETPRANQRRRRDHGTIRYGSQHPPEVVADVLARRDAGESVGAIAAVHGIATGTVSRICLKYGGRLRRPRPSRLTADDVRAIRQDVAQGVSQTVLAARYGVNRATIHYAVKGVTWAHVA